MFISVGKRLKRSQSSQNEIVEIILQTFPSDVFVSSSMNFCPVRIFSFGNDDSVGLESVL